MQFARLALCAVIAGLCAPVLADNPEGYAYVVSRPAPGLNVSPVEPMPLGKRWYDIVPSLTGVEMSLPYVRHDNRLDPHRLIRVDRKLPYQAELLLANGTSHYIPLYVDYRSQARPWDGGIDEDHSIVRAQRLTLAVTTPTFAHVVHNPLLDRSHEEMAADRVQPRAVIHVPEGLPQRKTKPKQAPEKPKPNQMARAN